LFHKEVTMIIIRESKPVACNRHEIVKKDIKVTIFITKAAIVETIFMWKHKVTCVVVHMGSKKETGEKVGTALSIFNLDDRL
jgi:hypothetical protein